MPANINSAYRIREILKNVKSKNDTTPIHEIWAEEFGLEDLDQNKKNFSVSKYLANLHDEVELVRNEMFKLDYSSKLFSPSLDACNSIFAVHTLMSQWKGIKLKITPEVMVVLGFCSEILPNEEDLLDQDSIDELQKVADDLRVVLNKSKLPQYTISIIEKHLNKIDEALSTYKIVGAKAFEEVLQSAYGEVIANEAIFEEAKGSEEISKLSIIWQKTMSTIDGVVSANKRISGVQGMAEKGQQLLELFGNIN